MLETGFLPSFKIWYMFCNKSMWFLRYYYKCTEPEPGFLIYDIHEYFDLMVLTSKQFMQSIAKNFYVKSPYIFYINRPKKMQDFSLNQLKIRWFFRVSCQHRQQHVNQQTNQ